MNYEQDEQEFLEAMATRFSLANTRRHIFIQRFLEANSDLDNTQLAEVLELACHLVRDNLKEICDSLKTEGCDFGNKQRGRWTIAKKWLRFEQYPQWKQHDYSSTSVNPLSLDWIWNSLKEKATLQDQWLHFRPAVNAEKGIVIPPARQSPLLKSNAPYLMNVDLQASKSYLLLLNQGLDTKYVLSPSMAFAPERQLSGKPMWIPQLGAMCKEITFDAKGKEEFLAIAVEEMPAFSWLVPSEAEPAPELEIVRLNQLWNWLQQRERWQVFYQAFEVAE